MGSDREKINQVLKIIADKLEGINYAFIGSANLYLQGLKVEPRDIDILTTPGDIKKIDEIFCECRIKEIYFDESEGINSFRSFYNINGMEIDVFGNVNNLCRKLESLDEKIFIDFEGVRMPGVSLIYELDTYRKMGRHEKAEMIKEFFKIQTLWKKK